MKITFILPFAGVAGGVNVVAIHAKNLTRLGHDVVVVSQPAPAPSFKEVAKSFLTRKKIVPKSRTPLLDFLGPKHVVVDCPRPITDNDVPDADFVVATWWETAEWVNTLSPAKGKKIYLLQDYEMFPYLPLDRVEKTFTLPFQRIAVSSYIKHTVERNHDVAGIQVIPNGVDHTLFQPGERHRSPNLTLGALYSPSPRKNFKLTHDIMLAAADEFPDSEFVVFGASDLNKEYSLPKQTSFYRNPDRAKIPSLYQRCSYWLFTSESEGFGLPILEAMACGTVVLATRAGAAPDLIADRVNGFLLDSNVDAFMAIIRELREIQHEEWLGYSRAAIHEAQKWDWESSTAAFLKALGDGDAA